MAAEAVLIDLTGGQHASVGSILGFYGRGARVSVENWGGVG